MGKLGKKARKFAKKNLQSVLRKKRKNKALFKRKTASVDQRGDIEKYDALLSEEQSKGKLGDNTIEATAFNVSLDNIYIQDDVDLDHLVEDESDSEGILSEDPECPYVSDIELETNCQDNSERGALSESNRNMHMKIVEQKRKLDRLLEEVPKFSKFLESRGADLQKSNNGEIDSDEEGTVAVNETMLLHDRRAINSYTLDVWCWLVVEQPEGPALPILLNTFQAACRYGFDLDESLLHEIPDKKVFSKVMMFILCEADGFFRRRLGVTDSCNIDSFLKLKSASEWKLVRPLMKSYLRSCLLLLNQVTDGQILAFILCRLRSSIVFFAAFPSLTELLIKTSVHLWVTAEESLALSSFLVVREISSKLLSDWYDSCLTKTYKAFIVHLKFLEPGNLKQVEFLKNSFVELYSLDLQRSLQRVLACLQELAKILSQAMKSKKKEELKKIHSWQYINCISLWVKFIDYNLKDHDLQPLLSLSIFIIKGIIHLFPGLRYLPLRFRCVNMLNQLSFSSGVFIPIASLFFECLEHKGCTADTTRVKAFDFSTVLKVPKHMLKSRNFQEECILSAVELLSAHFSQWKYHISFPELVTIPLILFKRVHEKTSNETLRRHVKHFIDQVEQNKEYIERKRDETSFSPNDHAAIDSFFQMEKRGGSNCSFTQFYASVLQKSHSRSTLR